MTDYHQTVIGNATPFGEFTKWLRPFDNKGMDNADALALRALRKLNLRRFMNREGLNQSDLARKYADYRTEHEGNSKPVKPSFFNDLLRDENKSFGEKLALALEKALHLKHGELSKKNSPLEMDHSAPAAEDEVLKLLNSLPPKRRAQFIEKLGEQKPKDRRHA